MVGRTGGLRMCDWPDVVCCGSMLMSWWNNDDQCQHGRSHQCMYLPESRLHKGLPRPYNIRGKLSPWMGRGSLKKLRVRSHWLLVGEEDSLSCCILYWCHHDHHHHHNHQFNSTQAKTGCMIMFYTLTLEGYHKNSQSENQKHDTLMQV